MKRPFLLAQVALKAYAIAFAFLSLISLPILLTPSIVNIAFVLLLVGTIVGLLSISKGLSEAKIWAQTLAYVVFVGFAALTIPALKSSISDETLPEFVWPQIWTIIMLCIGIIGLLTQKPEKQKKDAVM